MGNKQEPQKKRESRLHFIGRVVGGVGHEAARGLKQEHKRAAPERRRAWREYQRRIRGTRRSSKSHGKQRRRTGTPMDWGDDLF